MTLTNSSRFTESIQLTKLCNQGVFAFSGGLQIPLQRERGSAWEHPNPRELENSPAVLSQEQAERPMSQMTINTSWDKETLSSLTGMGQPASPSQRTDSHRPYLYSMWPKLHTIKDLLP